MYEYGVYENDYALAPLVSNGLAWDEWNPEIPNEFIESPPEPIVEMPPYRRLPRSLRTLTPLENMNKVYVSSCVYPHIVNNCFRNITWHST